MKDLESLKQNTDTLYEVMQLLPASKEKLSAVVQLHKNLFILRDEMDTKEFKAAYNDMLEDVQNRIDKFTDPEFMKTLLSGLQKLIDSMK